MDEARNLAVPVALSRARCTNGAAASCSSASPPPANPDPPSRATVHRIAHLARIAVTEDEAARLEKELSGILDWVAQLDDIDTTNLEPMTRVVAMTMKKRKDEVTDGNCADDILKNAPSVDDHYFVVPKIVE